MAQKKPSIDVKELADQCVGQVKEALDFELDYTLETLPVLDHFCRQARQTSAWSEEAERMALTLGAYFGEVIRRHYDGECHWHISNDGSHAWRLEFESCFICFNPLGAVLELLLDGEAQGWNADFVTLPEASEALQEHLERLPGVSEEDFYMLSVRSEVLETIYAFLELWEREKNKGHPRTFDTVDYASHLETLRDDMTANFE